MVQLDINERRLLLEILERESRNAVRMMRSFPHDRVDDRPVDCPHSARELAWRFVIWERLAHYVLFGHAGRIGESPLPTMPEILHAYEDEHAETRLALLRMTRERWEERIHGPVTTETWERGSRGDLLWMAWKALVHHGEHFAAHLRLAREEGAIERGCLSGEPLSAAASSAG